MWTAKQSAEAAKIIRDALNLWGQKGENFIQHRFQSGDKMCSNTVLAKAAGLENAQSMVRLPTLDLAREAIIAVAMDKGFFGIIGNPDEMEFDICCINNHDAFEDVKEVFEAAANNLERQAHLVRAE